MKYMAKCVSFDLVDDYVYNYCIVLFMYILANEYDTWSIPWMSKAFMVSIHIWCIF